MAKYFKIPFAYQGDNISIPDELQTNGTVSYWQGFGYDYQRRLGTDPLAKPVPRQQTNQLYNDITNSLKQYQEHGFFDFITPEMNGGDPFPYSMGACVRYDMSEALDGSDVRNFSSKINDNVGNPKDNPDDWSDLADVDITFASNEEAQQGIETDKVISPSTLASVTATTTRRGLIQTATDDEVKNGSNTTKAVTPSGLLAAFSNSSLSQSGYQKLPNGLLIQWALVGNGANISTDTTENYSFPITFPNTVFGITATLQRDSNTSGNWGIYAKAYSNSQFTITYDGSSSSTIQKNVFILAIGN